ncbi:MAG: InlB B-repeat-containing protein [Clostridiales bacterium]|nr:InlB B-repeat-containing protein [Clostridiales bacterium]
MKKLLSIALALIMVFCMLPAAVFAEDVVEIANYEQLKAFAARVNGGEHGLSAKLTEDITCKDKTWTPIGLSGHTYQGRFNGQGHSITGLSNADVSYSGYVVAIGLFGDVGGSAVIQNVAVKNCDLTFDPDSSDAMVYAGAIAAANGGTVENCYCTGTVHVASEKAYVGGIVGGNSGTVQNCYNTGTVGAACTDSHGTVYVGGVIGDNSGTVKNCYNTGTVSAESEVNLARVYVGGVVGSHNGETVQDCHNTGAVSGSGAHSHVGGVVGYSYKKIQDCYNTGAVSGSGCETVGGVVGYTGSTVQACLNTGKVSNGSGAYVGGIAGSNTYGSVENCLNTGEISGTETDAGGVVGENFGGSVKYCLSVGTVSGTARGGVVGWCVNNDSIATSIENCYYLNTAASAAIGSVGTATVTNVSALTAEQLKSIANCVGFSADNWTEGMFYPVLKDFSAEVHLYANSNEDLVLQRFICAYVPTAFSNPFTYADHVFTGWNTDPDGDGTPYGADDEITAVLGEILSLYAQWREVVNYPLWVGGVQVTSGNMNDVLGDGSVKFEITEDGENVLTLTDANISGTYSGSGRSSYIRSDRIDLTIMLEGENTLEGSMVTDAIFAYFGNLTFAGEGSLTISSDSLGILGLSKITFAGGNVTVSTTSDNDPVVRSMDTITFSGGKLTASTASTTYSAVDAMNGIELGEGMGITVPVGGAPVLDTDYYYSWVIKKDGVLAQTVVIEKAYTVTYTINGEYYAEQLFGVGSAVTAPEYTVPEGHTFSGWQVPETMPAEDITLDATLTVNSYTVTYTVNGEYFAEQTYDYGAEVTAPTYEVPEGHTFSGWTVPETMPAEDITLDAALTVNSYTVTYTVNGEYFAEQTYEYGADVTAPAYEVPEGHTFSGWQVPETMPAEDITLDASLEIMVFTVTFVDGVTGEVIAEVEVEYGGAAEAPDAPEHICYLFREWDAEFDNVTEDLTVTAVYTHLGDVDGDGEVTPADAVLIMRYALELISDIDEDMADVNGDGKVDLTDALIVLRHAMGLN